MKNIFEIKFPNISEFLIVDPTTDSVVLKHQNGEGLQMSDTFKNIPMLEFKLLNKKYESIDDAMELIKKHLLDDRADVIDWA